MDLEKLKWKKHLVLNDGWVCLVDVMGNDASIVQAARTSYGKDKRLIDSHSCPKCGDNGFWRSGVGFEGEKKCGKEGCGEVFVPESSELLAEIDKDDVKLLRYLMRHQHSTPFEMVEFKFLIRIPMDAWRQMVRHRTASINEYSTRYAEAIDSKQVTAPDQWRSQATNNKQGSGDFLTDFPESWKTSNPEVMYTPSHPINIKISNCPTIGQYLSMREEELHQMAAEVYQTRLSAGVAKEQARKDLPLSTYTEAYWKIDLHNLFNFLRLRMDSHAQLEIRSYANAMASIVKKVCPAAYAAFEDYVLNSMKLSAMDIQAIQLIIAQLQESSRTYSNFKQVLMELFPGEKNRERDECWNKLLKLHLVHGELI